MKRKTCCRCAAMRNTITDFQKIIEVEDPGLIVYRYKANKGTETNVGVSFVTSEVYIVQNTKDKEINAANLIPDTGKISCPRCKHIVERAKRLIQHDPIIEGNIFKSICEHCQAQSNARWSCRDCQFVVKKFIYVKRQSLNPDEAIEKRLKKLKSIKSFLSDYDEIKSKHRFISYSDIFNDNYLQNVKEIKPIDVKEEEITIKDSIQKHNSINSLVTSFSSHPKDFLNKDFKYFFPKAVKKDSRTDMNRDSNELLEDQLKMDAKDKEKKMKEEKKLRLQDLEKMETGKKREMGRKSRSLGYSESDQIVGKGRGGSKSLTESEEHIGRKSLGKGASGSVERVGKKTQGKGERDSEEKIKGFKKGDKKVKESKDREGKIRGDETFKKGDKKDKESKDWEGKIKDDEIFKKGDKKDKESKDREGKIKDDEIFKKGDKKDKESKDREGKIKDDEIFKKGDKKYKESKNREGKIKDDEIFKKGDKKDKESKDREGKIKDDEIFKKGDKKDKESKDRKRKIKDDETFKKGDKKDKESKDQEGKIKDDELFKKGDKKYKESKYQEDKSGKRKESKEGKPYKQVDKNTTTTPSDIALAKATKQKEDDIQNLMRSAGNRKQREERLNDRLKQKLKNAPIKMNTNEGPNVFGAVKMNESVVKQGQIIEVVGPEVKRKKIEKADATQQFNMDSELELERDSLRGRKLRAEDINNDVVYCNEIIKKREMPPDPVSKNQREPRLRASKGDILEQTAPLTEEKTSKNLQTKKYTQPDGRIRYALSDHSFIEKGWTHLPTEKVVRKMNVYRMHPANSKFDWFKHNKAKRIMHYDSGAKLAEFTDEGQGKWFYSNGKVALDYYNSEDKCAKQRFVIYSNGEPDERGRARPVTVLGMFDYIGNGVVYDHNGNVRLKYNQTEGVVVDREIGPSSHWKWHSLNEPPVLKRIMIDNNLPFKDPKIEKLGQEVSRKPRSDHEEMLAIEFDNFIKEKSRKFDQKYKPFQIRMKSLKINENFSLKVLDQSSIYLLFRDGRTHLKLNLGMTLDSRKIVDTDTSELYVNTALERLPAQTDSVAAMQRKIKYVQDYNKIRTERERRLHPLAPRASVDRFQTIVTKPLKPPLQTAHFATSTCEYQPCCNRPHVCT